MSALAELLERVKAATGPNFALDWDVHITVRGIEGAGMYGNHPAYTASLDVALALVERVLPGTKKAFSHRNYQYDGWIVTLVPETGLAEQGRSTHPALAVLVALVSALARRAAQGDVEADHG